ncbi:MAG: formylmethanofuran dehydrogenase subunit C [Vicinamibacterales bacterium]
MNSQTPSLRGVTLTLRNPLTTPVDAAGLALDTLATLSEDEIANTAVAAGRTAIRLGDVFSVQGGRSSHVEVRGDVRAMRGLGTAMRSAELWIDGNAGDRVGAGMTGGSIHVRGNVGNDSGVGMSGGLLHVSGSAGSRLGAAGPGCRRGMTGGEIVVLGDAGAEAGTRMRRGLIAIGGSAGEDLGRDIIAGTIVALGRVGHRPGRGNKRGSIIALGKIEVPGTYALACEFEPAFVRLIMTYLKRQFGLSISPAMVSGRFRRYCGDAGLPGKGEILEWRPA